MGSRRRLILGGSLALLAPVALLWLAAAAPFVASAARTFLVGVGVAAAVVDVIVLVALAAVGGGSGEDEADEEPLLRRPRLPARVRDKPVLGVVGLEPEAGASTVALNAAVALALHGRLDEGSRRPLPLCVLTEGSLTRRLGISGDGMRASLRRHPGGHATDLLAHAWRVAGCVDVLCLPADELGGGRLARLILSLRRDYDAIVVDCSAGDRFLAAALADQADVLLACVLAPHGPVGEDAERAAAKLLAGRTNKAALLINRQSASGPFESVLPEFSYRVELPDHPAVERCDRAGQPWVLWRSSPPADHLRQMVAHLLPRFQAEGATRAA